MRPWLSRNSPMTTATTVEKRGKIKIISIQPESPAHDPLKMPYPYHIERYGRVGRQDFWKGSPHHLVGFSKKPVAGTVDFDFEDFWFVPEIAIGLYAVFARENGEWYTLTDKITSYHINRL